ncbi:very long chain fatty acid elongase 7 isoform X3 [Halyomorpha halys]|uniref:very long chain fatty acid elongase 7 isoform X3 n=1 Tax=Halyomorpha halys TaxID=286706 RepID=UPI0034D256F4
MEGYITSDENATSYELPRIEDNFLLFSSCSHIPVVLLCYFLAVKAFGPKWMKDKRPFVLRRVISVYNLSQVAANAYLLYLVLSHWGFNILRVWSHVCNPITETIGFDYKTEYRFLEVLYYYHITKIIDLFDTIFFVLRKKESQITMLHMFHHSTMVVNSWLTMAPLREQVSAVFGVLNLTVHVLMYAYYFLAGFGPKVQKYLWWKKHITRIQLLNGE